MFRNISYENIKKDSEKLILIDNDSYIESYVEFIKYFENINVIEKHHLIIASHFVYGWMPTIIHLNTKELERVLFLLNAAKSGKILTEQELEILKYCVNNSMVGTSKLLHFINPRIYAIWDRRIYRYLTGEKSSYGIGNPRKYLEYLAGLQKVTQHQNYDDLHFLIERRFSYNISPMRAIEFVMFETDRNRNLM